MSKCASHCVLATLTVLTIHTRMPAMLAVPTMHAAGETVGPQWCLCLSQWLKQTQTGRAARTHS